LRFASLPLLSLAAAALLASGCAPSASTREPSTTLKQIELTPDGAWCWFQDPRAVYIEGARKRTYAGWITRSGQLRLGAYDHETGEIETVTIREDWDIDDHNVNSFLVLPDNRLMIFYARHNKRGLYCRTATAPESITEWEDEVVVTDTDRITYSHPCYLAAEKKIYVFFRGPTWKPTFCVSTDGKNWSGQRILIQNPEHAGQDVRPYTKVTTDGVSQIFITFTDGHPRNEPFNSVYFVRYADGQWTRADGSVVAAADALPIAPAACDLVYDARPTAARAWVHDIAIDRDGHPVIAYTRHPSETDHRYHYARWDGRAWLDSEITPAGRWFPQTPEGKGEPEPHYSGGMSINAADTAEIFLSRQHGDVFEIEKWTTPDGGATWEARPITTDSTVLNVRPVVPRGWTAEADHVLWMAGSYRHYTDFATGIRMLVPVPVE